MCTQIKIFVQSLEQIGKALHFVVALVVVVMIITLK